MAEAAPTPPLAWCFHAGAVAWVERSGLLLWLVESDSAGPLVLDASTSSTGTVWALLTAAPLFARKRKRPPPWTLCSVGATEPAIAADVSA